MIEVSKTHSDSAGKVGSAIMCPELLDMIQRVKGTVSERMLRLPQVKSKTGYAASTIWKACKDGNLPPPIAVGVRSVAWKESELQAWIEASTFASRTKRSFDMKLFIKLLIAPPEGSSEWSNDDERGLRTPST